MKKVIIFLAIIIALFVAIAVVTKMQQSEKMEGNPYGKTDLRASTIDQLDDPLYQNIILPDELEKKLKDKQNITVYFFSPECPHCVQTTPVVSPLAKDLGIDLLQYNLLEFNQGFNLYNIEYTPTIIHFKDGKEQARIVGAHPKEDFEQFFNENIK